MLATIGGDDQVTVVPYLDAERMTTDPIHGAALRAALLTGKRLQITGPGESEDLGVDWNDPAALTLRR